MTNIQTDKLFNVNIEWFDYANDLCLDILNALVCQYYYTDDEEAMFNEMMNLVATHEIFLVDKESEQFAHLASQNLTQYFDFDMNMVNNRLRNQVAIVL